MEIKPTYVTFEQAKWLKDIGFQVGTRKSITKYLKTNKSDNPSFATKKGEIEIDNFYIINNSAGDNSNENYISCEYPEHWMVIEWFEKKYQKYIYAFRYNGLWQYKIDGENSTDSFSKDDGFKSKQEAYSAAFDYIKQNNLLS